MTAKETVTAKAARLARENESLRQQVKNLTVEAREARYARATVGTQLADAEVKIANAEAEIARQRAAIDCMARAIAMLADGSFIAWRGRWSEQMPTPPLRR